MYDDHYAHPHHRLAVLAFDRKFYLYLPCDKIQWPAYKQYRHYWGQQRYDYSTLGVDSTYSFFPSYAHRCRFDKTHWNQHAQL